MARNRTPRKKAEVSGASLKNPSRYEGRKSPQGTHSLGEPYEGMNESQKEYWYEFRETLPWLNSSHKRIVKLACILSSRMDDPDFSITTAQVLSAILSKLGATPVDESKVNYDPKEDDQADEFFYKTH
jgi:hypothetical protein